MAKIQQNNVNTKKSPKLRTSLDTSVVLDHASSNSHKNNGLHNLQKRAKSKFLSDALALKMVDFQKNEKDTKSYWSMWKCSRLLMQKDQTIISQYCNNRLCLTCNRIRTAKLINGYSKPLSELKDAYFVTLTIKNCEGEQLKELVDLMINKVSNIQRRLHRKDLKIKGIRKLETNHSFKKNTFHPHFHYILDGKQAAESLILEWLYDMNCKEHKSTVNAVILGLNEQRKKGVDMTKYCKLDKTLEIERKKLIADPQWQDMRTANTESINELFKYFTKVFTKQGANVKALDIIMRANKHRNLVQPLGIKKIVSEDVDEITSVVYSELESDYDVWEYIENDWYSRKHGTELTGYIPDTDTIKMKKKIF